MPDALRWLWREYPAPIVVHELPAAQESGYDTSNRVFSTIYLDKPWQQIGNFNSILSMTADRKGNVYLSDRERKGILRIDPQGRTTPFAGTPDSGIAQAAPDSGFVLRMGPEDRLYAYIPETKLDHLDRGTIVSWSTANGAASDKKVVASGFDKLDIVNGGPADVIDFTLMQNGTIYALLYMGVVRIDPSGQMSTVLKWDGLLSQMGPAAAIALSPDQSMAVVVGQLTRYGWSFQLTADGSLQNGEPFYRLEMEEALPTPAWVYEKGNPAEDTDGMVYFPTALGIQVAMQNGRIVEILNPPVPAGGPLTAMTFAWEGDQNWLYVVQDGKLFRRPVKVTGANAWTVIKPPKPTL